jgi:hypothetical protein
MPRSRTFSAPEDKSISLRETELVKNLSFFAAVYHRWPASVGSINMFANKVWQPFTGSGFTSNPPAIRRAGLNCWFVSSKGRPRENRTIWGYWGMAVGPGADSQGLWPDKEEQVCSRLRLEGTNSGRTFTLLGDSDRARCHSRFHPPAMRDPRIHGKASYWGFSGHFWANKWELRHERAGQVLASLPARSTKERQPWTVNSEPVNAYKICYINIIPPPFFLPSTMPPSLVLACMWGEKGLGQKRWDKKRFRSCSNLWSEINGTATSRPSASTTCRASPVHETLTTALWPRAPMPCMSQRSRMTRS